MNNGARVKFSTGINGFPQEIGMSGPNGKGSLLHSCLLQLQLEKQTIGRPDRSWILQISINTTAFELGRTANLIAPYGIDGGDKRAPDGLDTNDYQMDLTISR